MIDRRSFARRALLLLVAPGLGKFLVSCSSEVQLPPARTDPSDASSGSDTTSSDETTETTDSFSTSNDAEAGDASDAVVFTSSIYTTHSHTFGIARSLLDGPTPPPSDLVSETSVTTGHAHTITVTVAQLSQIQAGETVMVTTGRTNAHTHVFTFRRV